MISRGSHLQCPKGYRVHPTRPQIRILLFAAIVAGWKLETGSVLGICALTTVLLISYIYLLKTRIAHLRSSECIYGRRPRRTEQIATISKRILTMLERLRHWRETTEYSLESIVSKGQCYWNFSGGPGGHNGGYLSVSLMGSGVGRSC